MYNSFPKCARTFQHTLGRSKLCKDFPVCPRCFHNVQKITAFFKMRKDFPMCARTFQNAQKQHHFSKCAKTVRNVRAFSRMYQHFPECTRTFQNEQKSTNPIDFANESYQYGDFVYSTARLDVPTPDYYKKAREIVLKQIDVIKKMQIPKINSKITEE